MGASLKVGNLEYGAVELDAIAARIASDVIRRVAEATVLTARRLRDDGNPLGELQEIESVYAVIQGVDGVESEIYSTLKLDASTTRHLKLIEARDDA